MANVQCRTRELGRRHRPRLGQGLLTAVACVWLTGCATSVSNAPGADATGSIEHRSETPAGETSEASKRAPVKVALLLPLTGAGQAEPVANAMRQAAELALFDQSNSGVQMLVKDDKGTPEGARAAADAAIRDGAEIILGPLFANTVTAATAAARAAKVPVLAFSSDRGVAGNGNWLISFLPQQEVHRIVAYAAGQGRRRFAALVPADAYGRLVEAAFRDAVTRNSGQIVALESYELEGNGLMTGTRALKDKLATLRQSGAGIDALFLPAAPEHLASLANLLPQMQLDLAAVKIIGAGWDAADFANLPVFHGAWYAGPDPAGWRDFSTRFGKANGVLPPRIAALAHDAIGIASALSTAPKAERYSSANLTRPGGFTGVDGQVRLNADGTSDRALAILEVRRDGSTVLEPAAGFSQTRLSQR